MRGSTSRLTITIFSFAALSSLLGFVRELYIAFRFGANGLTDSFYVALIIPDSISGLFQAALNYSLVPVLKAEKTRSSESARRLVLAVINFSFVFFSALAIVAFLARSRLVSLLAPGLSPMEHLEAVRLFSIMVIGVILTGTSGALWGVNNAFDNFTFPALTGVAYNVIVVSVSALFAREFGIESLALGVAVGALGRLVIQFIPMLSNRTVVARPTIWHPAIPEVARLMPPVLISSGLSTVNLVVDRMLASSLSNGNITNLNYAAKVGVLPAIVINASLATILYNRFVLDILDNNYHRLRANLTKGITWALFLGTVVGGGFIIFAHDIIFVLFRHGAFTLQDVEISAHPLIIFGLFQPFYLLLPVLDRVLYAAKKNKSVTVRSLVAVIVNIVVSIATVHRWGIVGLVLGNGLAQLVSVITLIILILKWLEIPFLELVSHVVPRGVVPAGFVCLAFMASVLLTGAGGYHHIWQVFFRDITAIVLGASALTVYAAIDRKSEVAIFVRKVYRWGRRSSTMTQR